MGHSQVLEKVSAHFAELLVLKIESMTQTWQKPWFYGQGLLPCNITGKRYAGTNLLTLLMLTEVKGYRTPVFLTFRQAKERGLTVRKGSKQFPVVFWKPFYQANNPTDGQRRYLTVEEYNALPESARAEYVLRFSLRYYPVLNLDQTDFEERFPEQWQKLLERQSMTPRPSGSVHPVLERLLAAQSWVCPILQKSGDAAFYSPCDDRIVLPRQEQFHDLEAFYSTMLHEMAHSTGSAGRLDRHLGEPSTAAYGREELVAEFSAALVGLGLGVSSGIRAENVAYLKAWLRELREKPVFIFSVLSDVQQVVRFFEEELCMRLFDTAPAENEA